MISHRQADLSDAIERNRVLPDVIWFFNDDYNVVKKYNSNNHSVFLPIKKERYPLAAADKVFIRDEDIAIVLVEQERIEAMRCRVYMDGKFVGKFDSIDQDGNLIWEIEDWMKGPSTSTHHKLDPTRNLFDLDDDNYVITIRPRPILVKRADLIDRLDVNPFKIKIMREPNIIKIIFSENWNIYDENDFVKYLEEDIKKPFEHADEHRYNLRSYSIAALETSRWMEEICESINRRFGTAFKMSGPDLSVLEVKLDHHDLENNL